MTDREQIEEIVKKVLKERTDIIRIPDLAEPISEALYNAGYRKVGETAKEIVKETVKDIVYFITNNCYIEHRDMTNIITFIKQRFGVEID